MAGPPKQAPLEAYLSSVAESSPPDPDRSLANESVANAAHVIILTILAQATGFIHRKDLSDRSELGAERFDRAVKELMDEGLIQTDSGQSYQLTDPGRKVAERERSRLLSLR